MEENSTIIANPDNRDDTKRFTFDYSYWSHDGYETESDGILVPDGPNSRYASQQKVYEDLGRGVLDNAFNGYACSLFAYGQTGSGKSYSVMGYGANRGIVPIVCEELFKRIEENKEKDKKFQVTFSMMEIYNEQIRDLLQSGAPSGKSLQIRQSPIHGFYVQNLTQVPVGSYKEIEQRMEQGTAHRTIAATNMNATSSRAHTLVTLTFDQFSGSSRTEGSRRRSVINLVDLAGSERAALTGATGDRLKEGANINRSLSALGNVISALAEGKKTIPYRDSALTKLLQNALGGNSKTIMIAAISPADINYHETMSTLRYADRAKHIKNQAKINDDPMKSLIRDLKSENDRLKRMLQSSELPASVVTKGMSAEEVKIMKQQMREQMEEEMRANMAELEAQNQQVFEEKLAQARKEATGSKEKEEKSGKSAANKPFLSNLNEDPQLSGVICHVLTHKTTGFGRKPPRDESDKTKQKVSWITLQGLGLADLHALLIRHGKPGAEVELRVCAGAAKATKVNGVPLMDSITLRHKDRVLFGSYQLFVFHNPLDESTSPSTDPDEKIDWEYAQKELAQATGIDGLDSKPKSREDLVLQKELLELIPMVTEANAISDELSRNRSFDVLLIPPTAQGLLYGEPKKTTIMVRMRDVKNQKVWLWEKEKFMDRRFLMQEMYQNGLQNEKVTKNLKEDDPYEDEPEDRLIGIAPAYLQALCYRLDVDDHLTVTSLEGEEVGKLFFQLIPCTRSGKPLTELDATGMGHCDFIDDPNELLGKPFYFKVDISDLNLESDLGQMKVSIRYRIFKESEWTCVEFPDDYFDTGPNAIRRLIDHSRVISIQQVTFEHVDYFSNDCICFLIYCSQDEKYKQRQKGRLAGQEMSAIANSVKASRRYSRVQTEEYSDVNKLKTELNLLQRDMQRFSKTTGHLTNLVGEWGKKKPNADNYGKLIEELQKLVDPKTLPHSKANRKCPINMGRLFQPRVSILTEEETE